jgi:hypothetical protein
VKKKNLKLELSGCIIRECNYRDTKPRRICKANRVVRHKDGTVESFVIYLENLGSAPIISSWMLDTNIVDHTTVP